MISSSLLVAALLMVGSALAADPWLDAAYQQRQWTIAMAASTDGYLAQKCLSSYKQTRVTVRPTATQYSLTTLAKVGTAFTTVTGTTTAWSTSVPTVTVHVSSTVTSRARFTTTITSMETVTSTSDINFDRLRRRDQDLVERATKQRQQIDTIFAKLKSVNEAYLRTSCGSLTAKTVTMPAQTVTVPSTVLNIRGRTVVRSVFTTATSVKTQPVTAVVTDTVSVTTTIPYTQLVKATTTITVAPTAAPAPIYVTCPDPVTDYFIQGVNTTDQTLTCGYGKLGSPNTYACSWTVYKGTLLARTGDISDLATACPSQLTSPSESSGDACAIPASCPDWDGHVLDTYRSGQSLVRSQAGTASEAWFLNLDCVYDAGDSTCSYDQDAQGLVDGDDECPDMLDDGYLTGACAFTALPPPLGS